MKVRIIKCTDNYNERFDYKVQEKTLFGWKDLYNKVSHISSLVSFLTYQEAEEYIFKTFFIQGGVEINGNEYTYKPYYYFV